MRKSLLFFSFSFFTLHSIAGPGDTTIVQTFTFEAQNNPETNYDSPGRRWFQFPSGETAYQKVLMYYTLKCFEDGTAGGLGFPCGEWDYLTYTYLFEHTGLLDSNLVSHPHFLANNLDFDNIDLTTAPRSHTFQYPQISRTEMSILGTEQVTPLGTADLETGQVLTDALRNRSQFLWTAEELMAAGLDTQGTIDKISFYANGPMDPLTRFEIRMANTAVSVLNSFSDEGLATHYQLDFSIAAAGWTDLMLHTPFVWDGISNLLIEFSHSSDAAPLTPTLMGYGGGAGKAISSAGDDRYLHFDWGDEVRIPAAAFEGLSDEITISFWQFGDAVQPQDGTVFEGVNAQNQRVLNVHAPWSNGRIYWDGGWDGGYDRIDKQANTADYEGRWNHWTFVKDASLGVMQIYLNGNLWHSGTNLNNPMAGITEFSLGGATGWSNFYNGSIDEFAIFDTALDGATIAEWMNKDLDASMPAWDNLLVYYRFNENDGEAITDASGNNFHGQMHGNAGHRWHSAQSLWRNIQASDIRPALFFKTGSYSTTTDEYTLNYTTDEPLVSLAEYQAENYYPVVTDISYWTLPGYAYVYNTDGVAIDSVWVASETTVVNDDFSYYQAPFEVVHRHELNRFITPYGIQLDMGEDGWTWVTEVTDWLPLLRDSVELESGNWQELLDLKFAFIEGPAARDPYRVEVVWDRNHWLGDFDTQVTETEIPVLPGEETLKVAVRTSGHGFGSGNNCAEFCSNDHSVIVNGTEIASWDVMRDCADNPLYPQGGTWIYARAGWCPGMDTDKMEFELTPFISGDSFTLDYDIEEDPYGNYVFFTTLFTYGSINHAIDAEIDRILAPSDWKIDSRANPMCDNPKVVIRNKGSQPLTSLELEYYVEGGSTQTHTWTGSLDFMESAIVELTYSDPVMYQGSDEEHLVFHVAIHENTGSGADENTSNNHGTSTFFRPPVYTYGSGEDDDNRMIIILKTNAAYWQSSYTLSDINGNVVFARDDFSEPNTTYRDTIQLNEGCYRFLLEDSGDDGLSFFANNDGNGQCRLDRVSGLDFENFEADFGREVSHYFYFQTDLVSVDEPELPKSSLTVFPNPGAECMVRMSGFSRQAVISVVNSSGEVCYTEKRNGNNVQTLPLRTLSPGIYLIRVQDEASSAVRKWVKE